MVAVFYFKEQFLVRFSIPKDKGSFTFLLRIILFSSIALAGANLGDPTQTNWMVFSAVNRLLLSIALILSLAFLIPDFRKLQWRIFLGLLAIAMIVRLLAILSAPNPPIDIFYILRDGPKLLLQLKNPYELFYPAPYGVYIPNIIFHYGPLTPFIFLPSVLLFNDPRFILILVEALSAFLIYKIARRLNIDSEISIPIVLIYLFHPFFPFMIEHAWPESLTTLFFLIALYFSLKNKKSWIIPTSLGSLLAIKAVYFLPFLVFLVNIKSKIKNLAILFAVPIVLSLPFLLADPKLFLERTQIYVTNPEKIAGMLAPNNISLSISAVILKYTGFVLPTPIAAIPGILIAIAAILKKPKGAAFSVISVFLVFMFLFMFGPYAFLYNFTMMGNFLLIAVLFLLPQKENNA